MAKTIDYLGFRFLDADMEGVRDALQDAISKGAYGYVVTPNVDHAVQYHSGEMDLIRTYADAMFQICDSRILTLLARLSGKRLTPCPGSDLTESLLERPLAGANRIAVIGPDRPAFADLTRRYPDLPLVHIECDRRLRVGSRSWHDTIERARQADWDILLICLSFPKQEFFARDLGRAGRKTGLALCIGASVDFLTGRQKRAPRAMQKSGLEWLHRLASDPRRMYERYLVRGPEVFLLAARDALGKLTPPNPRSRVTAPHTRRILFLTTVLPHGMTTGGEICSMNFIDALRATGCDVDVVGYERAGAQSSLPAGFASPMERTIESASSTSQSVLWLARALLARRPFSIQKYVTSKMAQLVRQHLREHEYDAVVVDHAQASWLLPYVHDRIPIIHVAHNAEHRLYGIQSDIMSDKSGFGIVSRLKARIYRREARLLWEMERRTARRFREIWTLSPDDALAYKALLGNSEVKSFGVPGKVMPVASEGVPPVHDVGLLGNWTWNANQVGLDWFMDEVVPELDPGISITVAGRSALSGRAKAGVEFAGYVPDAATFLQSCKVVAIPSTAGSGVQIKTIETIALGIPAVATPVAMRGLTDVPATLRVCARPEEMARAIEDIIATGKPDVPAGRRWWLQRRSRFEDDVRSAIGELMPRRRQGDAANADTMPASKAARQ